MTGDQRPPITGATSVLAIFARPVEHVLSTLIHNAALAAAGEDAVFVPFSPHEDALEDAMRGIVAAGCRGLCITIPFKTQIAPLLDALAPSARETGAVNTVEIEGGGRLVGHNTDVDGVLRCIAALRQRDRTKAVVLGAGGAGRAAAVALIQAGFTKLTIANRSAERGATLARELTRDKIVVGTADVDDAGLGQALADADLLVNTTPVGMYPDIGSTPVPTSLLRSDLDVIDAIYRPEPTRLCREARSAGASAITGVDWLIAQGVISMRHWMGFEPDEVPMRAALMAFLNTETD